MPIYEVEVEIETDDLSQSIQDRWTIEAANIDDAKAKADADFAKRQTVHTEGTLRVTDREGKSFERPFLVGSAHADWI